MSFIFTDMYLYVCLEFFNRFLVYNVSLVGTYFSCFCFVGGCFGASEVLSFSMYDCFVARTY